MTLPRHLLKADLLDSSYINGAKKLFEDLFGLPPPSVPVYIHKGRLHLQLGSTWIPKDPSKSKPPIIQLHPRLLESRPHRKGLKGILSRLRSLFRPHYTLEEVLAHEWVHCYRAEIFPKCNELAFEEILAYQTSSKPFRKYLGPLLSRPSDVWILASSLLLFWIDALDLSFLNQGLLTIVGLGGLGYLLVKLAACQSMFRKAQKGLKGVAYPLGSLLKMGDKKIAQTARSKQQEPSLS